MNPSPVPDSHPSKRRQLPRWTAPPLWVIGTLVVHVALPWAISLLSRRYGWVEGHPGWWNWIGLLPVAAGLAMILWAASLHFAAAPDGWEMTTTPDYILVKGPYQFSRNPMYLLELGMWLGWAVFYGSTTVLIACVLLWVIMAFRAIPREERQLEERFGEEYLQYKKTVPRWFGLPRR